MAPKNGNPPAGASERQLRRKERQLRPKLLRWLDQLAELVEEYQIVQEQLHGAEEVAPAGQAADARQPAGVT